MRRVVVGIFALIGLAALLVVVAILGIGLVALLAGERLPARAILELDFERGVVESTPDDAIARLLMEETPQVHDLVDALDRAAEDRRIVAVFARIGGPGMGLAHIQEIRDAVARFRESGKRAVAFADTFGEFGPGNGSYYLATAFDRIYLQPSGDVGLTGLLYESPFIRGLLDKLDVVPQMDQRREYKNAMNFYTHEEYNAPQRESMQQLMDSHFGQIVRGIAAARGLDEARVRALIDRGPFLAAEALDGGLVDELAYRDQVLESLEQEAGGRRLERIGARRYLEGAGRPHSRGAVIALIHGTGAVVRGEGGYSPIDGSVAMGSEAVSAAFRDAVKDDRVKAILFRVDSPGGSYVASDTIWRETVRAREQGKPVIVSMGNLAGSGGYFVAMNADKIVAQPGTITASIGVLGGKLVTRELWRKVGVTWDDVHTSEHSTMWSPRHPYGPAYERFQAMLDRIYEDFTTKVAAGRNMPIERVLEIAKGRIWTGEDALDLGLVDALGGLDVALALAREAAGLDPDAEVRIRRFPPERSTLELLFERADRRTGGDVRAAAASLAGAVQPIGRTLGRLGLVAEPGPLALADSMPTY
jgi:protease-4